MCGLAGIIFAEMNHEDWRDHLTRMGEAIRHRGPDDQGVWFDAESGVGMVHRRLSIIDTSPHGHQPMTSPSGHLVMAYNGEIYNYLEIKMDLVSAGISFRGESDSEVLLAAIEIWGFSKTLERLAGMFSFVIWDRRTRRMTLCRDRIGIKPLYYGWQSGRLYFASELHALRALPDFNPEYDRNSIALYTRYCKFPQPHTVYKGIFKLPPGCYLSIDEDAQGFAPSLPEPQKYWSAYAKAGHALENGYEGSFEEASDDLERLLESIIESHMISDVPLGAFLSGGIDSSLVCALMQKVSSSPIRTFSIGLLEKGYNEARYSKAVARHLGTEHTEFYLTPKEVMGKIPQILNCCDEPMADSSQIPTWYVSHLTRQHVTVALSGDGGDELFAGYLRYQYIEELWRKLAPLPLPLRRVIALGLIKISPQKWDQGARYLSPLLPRSLKQAHLGNKLHMVAKMSSASGLRQLYDFRHSDILNPTDYVLGSSRIDTEINLDDNWGVSSSFIEQMMLMDSITYLPDEILAKVDRASMGVSLEVRVPLLDHRLFEFAWSLPLQYKIKQGHGKRILRNVLYRHVPESLIDRPKMGFGIPIGDWMRGELRPWAEELLDEKRLREQGIFDSQIVRKTWQSHLKGEDKKNIIWSLLVFQNWIENEPKPLSRKELANCQNTNRQQSL
jgi:asparagine synthase (glutamine-hydrolysing)